MQLQANLPSRGNSFALLCLTLECKREWFCTFDLTVFVSSITRRFYLIVFSFVIIILLFSCHVAFQHFERHVVSFYVMWEFNSAATSKASVCGRSPAEFVGSNLTGGMVVCGFGCCVLSGRGLCHKLITLPEESYRMWCVVVCDLGTSRMRRPWSTRGCCSK